MHAVLFAIHGARWNEHIGALAASVHVRPKLAGARGYAALEVKVQAMLRANGARLRSITRRCAPCCETFRPIHIHDGQAARFRAHADIVILHAPPCVDRLAIDGRILEAMRARGRFAILDAREDRDALRGQSKGRGV